MGIARKRNRFSVLVVVLLSSCVLWGQANARSDPTGTPTNLTAMLTGAQVVPPVNTSAYGRVDFTVHHFKHHKDDSATYTISLYEVNHLVEIDMHQAHERQNGDRVAILWGPSPHGLKNEVNGTLTTGTLKRDAFSKGPMNKKDLNEFIKRSANGDMYVLVTTIEYPNGLLRGQVALADNTASSAAAVPGPQPGPGKTPAPEPQPAAAPTPGT
ncbi:g1664 [Coccomyxa elongata]